MIEGKATELAPRAQELPWWATIVGNHRDRFADCALAVIRPEEDGPAGCVQIPDVVWIISLVMERPHGVHLLKGELARPIWPCLEEVPWDEQLDMSILHPHYDVSGCDLSSACDIAVPEGHEVAVLCNIRFVGTQVVALCDLQPFDEFDTPFLRAPKKRAAEQNRREDNQAHTKCAPAVARRVHVDDRWRL